MLAYQWGASPFVYRVERPHQPRRLDRLPAGAVHQGFSVPVPARSISTLIADGQNISVLRR
ncbi:hypothetical protein LV779_15955 [Streptomyces thinghirensis]|nr:hypothetical protein [Streptomyces thinghirensis]